MKQYQLTLHDMKSNYFHFTLHSNLKSIEEKGLIPKKGKHAEHIEESEKVFFVQGLDNLIILFDCWINVYKKIPLFSKAKHTYRLGSKAMHSKYFPSFLVDLYFLMIRNSKRHKKYAYQIFDELLDNCVLLHLDLQEEVDFSFTDIDEIKSRGYRKRHLIELGYSLKYSDMSSNKMDLWNLHTLSNIGISPNKIKLCHINHSSSMRDILNYALEHTTLNVKEMCPVLFDYFNYYK